jgi:predicted cupin superfamily sugar epimerase
MPVNKLIELLNLAPHPKEGGFYRETYRAANKIDQSALPSKYPGPRSLSTAIYYLLIEGTCSLIHRLASDEIFHFYSGDPVIMVQLFPDGQAKTIRLGPDVESGQSPQVVVPANVWQGSILEPGGGYALMGCTVAPGFEFDDYEEAHRDQLLKQYGSQRDLIIKLTK